MEVFPHKICQRTKIECYAYRRNQAGYQTIAKYHKDIDTVVIQFVNTTNFEGYTWSLSEIAYKRIVKILRRQESS